MKDKLYVIKKYVMAPSVSAAIRKERKAPIDSVWVDDDWTKGQAKTLADAIGFQQIPKYEEDGD